MGDAARRSVQEVMRALKASTEGAITVSSFQSGIVLL